MTDFLDNPYVVPLYILLLVILIIEVFSFLRVRAVLRSLATKGSKKRDSKIFGGDSVRDILYRYYFVHDIEGAIIIDDKDTIIAINEKLLKMLGCYNKELIVGSLVTKIVPNYDNYRYGEPVDVLYTTVTGETIVRESVWKVLYVNKIGGDTTKLKVCHVLNKDLYAPDKKET